MPTDNDLLSGSDDTILLLRDRKTEKIKFIKTFNNDSQREEMMKELDRVKALCKENNTYYSIGSAELFIITDVE